MRNGSGKPPNRWSAWSGPSSLVDDGKMVVAARGPYTTGPHEVERIQREAKDGGVVRSSRADEDVSWVLRGSDSAQFVVYCSIRYK